MLTALVLQLIQCVVVLPESLQDQLNAAKVKDEPQGKGKQHQGQQEKDDDSKKVDTVSNVCIYNEIVIIGFDYYILRNWLLTHFLSL